MVHKAQDLSHSWHLNQTFSLRSVCCFPSMLVAGVKNTFKAINLTVYTERIQAFKYVAFEAVQYLIKVFSKQCFLQNNLITFFSIGICIWFSFELYKTTIIRWLDYKADLLSTVGLHCVDVCSGQGLHCVCAVGIVEFRTEFLSSIYNSVLHWLLILLCSSRVLKLTFWHTLYGSFTWVYFSLGTVNRS